jgi:hypothetical protein
MMIKCGWWNTYHDDDDGSTCNPMLIKAKVYARVHILVTKTASGCGYIIG